MSESASTDADSVSTMASEKVWDPLERPELGMVNTVSQTIGAEEWRTPELLTSVRLGPSLVIATTMGANINQLATEVSPSW